jgi:hypothetical protein
MRSLPLLLSALLIGGPSDARAPLAPARSTNGQECAWPKSVNADRRGKALSPRKLNELPSAQTYLAVDHRVDGCMVPVLASERRRPR